MKIRALHALTATKSFAGMLTWVAPGAAARLFGFQHQRNDDFLSRLMGAREAALAVGACCAQRQGRELWLRLGLACDVLDSVAAFDGARVGYFTRSQAGGLAAFSLFSAGLSTLALIEQRHGP